jgi:eukaryotic-like serine/threonine-protein kinase
MLSGPNLAGGRHLVLGKYRVLAELGHGGMADLYLAVSEGPAGFSKLFVIKRLRNADDPQHVAMFLDEARLAARLSHPNIVETYEIGEESGAHFMVMEHLPGPTVQQLRQRHSSQGRVPAGFELEIMCNVLEGLHYAHELCGYDGKPLRVVHRDLSPENVIVTLLGETKVLDFGIAKTLDSLSHTEAGFYKGKLTKMPPEQMLGETVDRRADIFAAGVMLWEGLAGRPLWGDLGGPAIAHCLASRDIPPLSDFDTDVPPELISLCSRAIHVDPEGRYPTALEFRAALQGYMQRHVVVVSRAQLGAFVAPLFVDERERISKVLESQLLPGRERAAAAAAAGTAPLSRQDTPASGPSGVRRDPTMRSDPYYAQPLMEAAPTSFERPATAAGLSMPTRPSRRPLVLLGAAAFVALAVFGIQRIMRGYEMSAADGASGVQLAPASRPTASAPPLPLPPTTGTSTGDEGDQPGSGTAGGSRRGITRRNRSQLPMPRRQPPARNEGPREGPPPAAAAADGTSWGGAINRRRLDDENPYGSQSGSAASRPLPERSIDRSNPWGNEAPVGSTRGGPSRQRRGPPATTRPEGGDKP